jgi:catechol 2,3-dioxygenase-like lactoylglutathione lyase family enzyme
MTKLPQVNGLHSIDLVVTEAMKTATFYEETWGLTKVSSDADGIFLRGSGTAPYLVRLQNGAQTAVASINLTASNEFALESLHGRVAASGIESVSSIKDVDLPGGGLGFAFKDPEGRNIRIITNTASVVAMDDGPLHPRKLSHIVLNAGAPEASVKFFKDVLGFKTSDVTGKMTFLRCCSDHHSIAITNDGGPTLNHIAFEIMDWESVMLGGGRMRDAGYPLAWGVGRHGPGDNVFAYFVGPDDVVIEYTAEVQQVDDTYKTGMPEDWKWPPGRIDQWGLSMPSDQLREVDGTINFIESLPAT